MALLEAGMFGLSGSDVAQEVLKSFFRRQTQEAFDLESEHALWGLLADASSESVRILRRGNVDLRRLWTDLQQWHRSA